MVENALAVTASHPVQMSDVTFRRTLANAPGAAQLDLALTDAAPRFVNIVVDGYGGPIDPQTGASSIPAVRLRSLPADPLAPPNFELSLKVVHSPGDAVALFASGKHVVSFTGCEFSSNGGNGIVVHGDSNHITLSGCNFFGNGLAGVRNGENLATVFASRNWWGDPVGAAGAQGDGANGLVDVSLPLAQPVVLGY